MASPKFVQSARQRHNILARHHGPDDPRTIEAARELAEAKAQAAQAEADRLRAEADALAPAS